MPKFTFDRNISLGNVISWGLLILGLGVGYQKIIGSTNQNSRDIIVNATAIANAAQKLDTSNQIHQADIGNMKIDIAVLKVDTANIKQNVADISSKMDQVLRQTK
jgi:hypothetical protein